MKYSISLIFALLIVIVSCGKKEITDEPEKEERLYNLRFSTSGYDISLEPNSKMSQKAQSAPTIDTSIIDRISYLIYTSNNTLVGKFEKTADSSDFGGFNIKLGKGSFKIGIVGYKSYYDNWTFLDYEQYRRFFILRFKENYVNTIKQLNNKESFSHEYVTFNVEKDSTYSPLSLKRLNARLEIEFLDNLPDDVESMTINYDKNYSQINPLTKDTLALSTTQIQKAFTQFDLKKYRGMKNVKITDIVYPYKKSGSFMNMRLDIKSSIAGRSRSIYLDNVEFKSNHVTKVSGEIYGNDISASPFKAKLYTIYQDTIKINY